MQVSVQTTKGLERKMTVEVPAERVDNEIDNRLRRLSRTAKVKGFRPGKVPFKVVKQQYGEDVQQEVMQELIQSSYGEALREQSLQPAGQPLIDPVDMAEGKGLKYTATFEVYPEVKLKKTEGLKVEQPVAEVSDEDVEGMIENMRKQRADWVEADKAATEGDRVIIDFEGKLKGEDFPGNSGQEMPVELGGGRMIPDFEKGLMGLKAGEEKSFDVKFPKDYQAEELQGKKVKFTVKAHRVEEQQLPELDDEFVKNFGVNEGGIDKLRADVREHMERELEQAIKRKGKEGLLDALVDANKLDLPNALVDEEIHSLQHDMARRMGMGEEADPHQFPRELFEERARKRVALGLLLGEIIKVNELKVDQAKVDAILADMTAQYGEQDQVIAQYKANPQVMRQIEAMSLEEQAVDLLREKATIKEKKSSFEDIMNEQPRG
ncbi:MAG: trigger factor [Gammaproteobacteria bacterium]|nr:trigger factor [Gammaproteobacteria bacterium]